MRICSICGAAKAEESYFYRNKASNILHTQCKDCYTEKRKKIWQEYYHKHGNTYRERAVVRNRKLKMRLRKQLFIYLSNKQCAKCGLNDPRVLEFDHIDPASKSFAIAKAVHDIVNWEKILAEIDKCQILCANCHKIKTAEEQGWYKNQALGLNSK